MNAQIAEYPLAARVFAYALLVLGTVGGGWFIARYTKLYRWYRTEIGRHLIAFSACVTAFYAYYTLVTFLPGLPGKGLIRLVLFTLLTATIVWRAWIFERLARLDRLDKRAVAEANGDTATG